VSSTTFKNEDKGDPFKKALNGMMKKQHAGSPHGRKPSKEKSESLGI